MHKNENSFSLKNIKIKEDMNKNKKYTKINKKLLLPEKSKTKNNPKKNNIKFSNKEKAKSQKILNGISKFSKKIEQNDRNLNRIDITMNFNLTNFTTYNDTNKILDKKFIENYSGKKEIFHKRQISDGIQKIKVINTGNYLNIKVNTKDNKTNTNKEIQNIKKMNNKSKIFKNKYINYDIRDKDNDGINNKKNYLYNSHKNLTSYENISKLKLNISDLKDRKEYLKKLGQKKMKKNNNNNKDNNINVTKSVANLKKKEKMKHLVNNNINNIPIDKNIFNKKLMAKNKLLKYKTFKNSVSESKNILKTDINSKKILITNSIKDKIENNKNKPLNKYEIILPNNKVEIFPLYINTNTNLNSNKKNKKYKINNSCDGLNNKGSIILKKGGKTYKTSRNNTNRDITNCLTDKNKINEDNNNLNQNKDKENNDINDKNENNDNKDNSENNPEIYFFSIIKMIQKSKNSVY